MSEKCPVCKNECEANATSCSICGFADEFGINNGGVTPEGAQHWLDTVVKPYRAKWEKEGLLAQLAAAKEQNFELQKKLQEAGSKTEVQNKDMIFYTEINDNLYKIFNDGTGRQKISDDEIVSFEVVGDWVYYENRQKSPGLYRIRIDGTGRQNISDDKIVGFNVVGDWVYYRKGKIMEPCSFYKMQIDGTSRQKISDDKILGFKVVDDWVYYESGDSLYRVQVDGTDRQMVIDDHTYSFRVVGDWVYYSAFNNGRLYKISTRKIGELNWFRRMLRGDFGYQKLSNDDIWDFEIAGDWVYYNNSGDDYCLCRMRIDGTGRQKLNGDHISEFIVVGDWVYYNGFSADDWHLYSIRIDGTGRQKLSKVGDSSSKLIVVGDFIYYYANLGGERGLYKISTRGDDKQKLIDGNIRSIVVINGQCK